jgi:RimJ/RimL family protein N-acetyltransferase
MIDFDIVLESENVMLRPIKKEDIDAFIGLTKDRSMWVYFTSDLSIAMELIKWVDSAIEETSCKKRLAFTIIDKEKNEIVGSTSFGNISDYDKRVEIGWTWIAKNYQGKGINNQIKYLMLKYCFENCDFERVELKTDVLNIPAKKALTRIGAIEEGILRSHTLMINNRRRDTIYYSVIKSEWNEVKTKNNWL